MTETAEKQTTAPAAKERQPLTLPRMEMAEYARVVWRAVVEKGTPLEDVLNPRFWSTVAVQFKPLALIEATTDDMAWYAQLLVVSCDRTYAKVVVLSYKDLVPTDTAEVLPGLDSEYEIRFGGPHLKHRIIRKKDGAVIKEGIPLRADAVRILNEYINTISAPTR